MFFSHCTHELDTKLVKDTSDIFKKYTTDDIFVSSDYSIPNGENFSDYIMDSIRNCTLMIVFITINSKENLWVVSESYGAMLLNKKVIPLIFDVELKEVFLPLIKIQSTIVNENLKKEAILHLIQDISKHLYITNIPLLVDELHSLFISSKIIDSNYILENIKLYENICSMPRDDERQIRYTFRSNLNKNKYYHLIEDNLLIIGDSYFENNSDVDSIEILKSFLEDRLIKASTYDIINCI